MMLLTTLITLQLNFDRPQLPDTEFRVTLTDSGAVYPQQPGFIESDPFSLAILPSTDSQQIRFVVKEFNANCLHNGVITLPNNVDLAETGNNWSASYSINTETCAYNSFSWQGNVEVLSGKRSKGAGQQRFPLYTNAAEPLVNADWQPQPPQQHPTVFGWARSNEQGEIIEHYSSTAGRAIPAYSLSKTFIATNAALWLEKQDPGEILSASIADWVAECNTPGWQMVSVQNALDMRTGHYDSQQHHADESAKKMISNFLEARTHSEKIAHACSYPAKSLNNPPVVYQSSNTYLLATTLRNMLPKATNTDTIDQLLYQQIWQPLQLSPLAYSIDTTKGDRQQAWGGYGLSLLPSDLVKLAAFVQNDPLQLGFSNILSSPEEAHPIPGEDNLRYHSSIWFWYDTENEQWYPFLSGYGGIMVVFLDRNHLYYLVSDQHDHRFADVVRSFQRWKSNWPHKKHGTGAYPR